MVQFTAWPAHSISMLLLLQWLWKRIKQEILVNKSLSKKADLWVEEKDVWAPLIACLHVLREEEIVKQNTFFFFFLRERIIGTICVVMVLFSWELRRISVLLSECLAVQVNLEAKSPCFVASQELRETWLSWMENCVLLVAFL